MFYHGDIMFEHIPPPRIWKESQVAALLGLSVRKFRQKLPALLREGFPSEDLLLGGFDSFRIQQWLEGRGSGIRPKQPTIAEQLSQRTKEIFK